MAKSDAEMRQRITEIADQVEALVRSISAVGVTRAQFDAQVRAVTAEKAKKADG